MKNYRSTKKVLGGLAPQLAVLAVKSHKGGLYGKMPLTTPKKKFPKNVTIWCWLRVVAKCLPGKT